MATLPDRTSPPEAIPRRHTPRKSANYAAYRSCLRWEFGFTCAFCLTHEADLSETGVEGTGLMAIDHRVPRSDPTLGGRLETDYLNCYYACRFCNGARGPRPLVDPSGRSLLDPCAHAWSENFIRREHHLLAVPDNRDAEYTHETYDLDEPRKVVRREQREMTLRRARRAVEEIPAILEQLMAATPDRLRDAMRISMELREHLRRAKQDLARFEAIPSDAPSTCRCDERSACTLPPHMTR